MFDHYSGAVTLDSAAAFDPAFTSSADTLTNRCLDLRAGCTATLPDLGPAATGANGPHTDKNNDKDTDDRQGATKVVAALPATGFQLPTDVLTPSVPAPTGGTGGLGTSPRFRPQISAYVADTPGAGALALIPMSGALLCLAVLVGFRRNERGARRLAARMT